MIKKAEIDNGRGFDWGRTSQDYAKYRDIYPTSFIRKSWTWARVSGQRVLDMALAPACCPAIYIHTAQLLQVLIFETRFSRPSSWQGAAGQRLTFCMPAEEMIFPDLSFDVVTACQCFTYFDHEALAPRLSKILCPRGA